MLIISWKKVYYKFEDRSYKYNLTDWIPSTKTKFLIVIYI